MRMTNIATEESLEPHPARAVELVLAVAHGAWPATDAAVHDLFAALGLRPFDAGGDSVANDATAAEEPADAATWPSPIDIHRLDAPFGGQGYASWTAHGGDFLGIDLQLYNEPHPNAPSARLGYDRIHALLSRDLGTPTGFWEDGETPPRQWEVGRWRIMLHHFALRDSGVMLSVDDAATADRAEREASARQASWEAREGA